MRPFAGTVRVAPVTPDEKFQARRHWNSPVSLAWEPPGAPRLEPSTGLQPWAASGEGQGSQLGWRRHAEAGVPLPGALRAPVGAPVWAARLVCACVIEQRQDREKEKKYVYGTPNNLKFFCSGFKLLEIFFLLMQKVDFDRVGRTVGAKNDEDAAASTP